MLAPTDSRRRSVRTGLFVLVAAQIAVVGHVVGGGMAPDLTELAAMSALLILALRPLAVRRYRFPALLTAMAGTQLGFHLVLTVAAAGHPGMGAVDPVRMIAFHAAAALLAAGLLAHGDRLWFALHGWLTRQLPRPAIIAPVTATPGWTAVVDRGGRTLRARLVGSTVSRRGPPTEPAPSC